MNARRTLEVARLELLRSLRRPVVWVLVALTLFLAHGLADGNVRIGAGDSTVGGTKAFITSEFAVAQVLCVVDFLLFTFFLSAIAGLAIQRDDELGLSELLRATALRPGEYVVGKFLASAAVYGLILSTHVGASIFFNHVLPAGEDAEFLGPFALANYVRPALFFASPPILFVCAFALMVGTRWRRPVLVFVLPLALMFGCMWLWSWSPSWLPTGLDRLLMFLDPAGFRWLTQEFLTVDRGVEFYNHATIPLDGLIVSQRLFVLALTGLCLVATARGLRGRARTPTAGRAAARDEAAPETETAALDATLADLGLRRGAVPFLVGLGEVARVEARAILRSPVLWLLLPIIVLMVLSNAVHALGPFETPLLLSAGHTAVRMLNWLTGLSCILLMLYTVEALHRERAVGLDPIVYAAPIRTPAFLLGKVIAASFIGLFVLAVMFLSLAVCTAAQGRIPFDPAPYALVWGLLAVPTFLFFAAFTAAAYARTGSRMTTYAAAFGLLALTIRAGFQGDLDWRTNWSLFRAVQWSDLAPFELNGTELL
ncbi:MAG: ABC transporter permease, partial [Planctomycetota bacterium JB042]